MKFSVGYQLEESGNFLQTIMEHKDSIGEIYFSAPDIPNGRSNSWAAEFTRRTAAEEQEKELKQLKEAGFKMNFLLNAMCYGADTLSKAFYSELGDTVDHYVEHFGVTSVTTTSPMIGKFLKDNFDGLLVRASVNMEIGTVEGMEYIADFFDEYYMRRENNRDFAQIRKMHAWCQENGKKLHMLANSGCLNNCSAHVFHDNLVAHEQEILKRDNAYKFSGVCKKFLKNPENHKKFLDYTNCIRPEDVSLYEPYFDSMKLATRVHNAPDWILRAYCGGRWLGNLAELLEPNHAEMLWPYIIDNSLITSEVKDDKLVYAGMEEALIKIEE